MSGLSNLVWALISIGGAWFVILFAAWAWSSTWWTDYPGYFLSGLWRRADEVSRRGLGDRTVDVVVENEWPSTNVFAFDWSDLDPDGVVRYEWVNSKPKLVRASPKLDDWSSSFRPYARRDAFKPISEVHRIEDLIGDVVERYPGAHALIIIRGEDTDDVLHKIAAMYVGYGWTAEHVTAVLGADGDSGPLDLGEAIRARTDDDLRAMIDGEL